MRWQRLRHRPAQRFTPWRSDFIAAGLLALAGAGALLGAVTRLSGGSIVAGLGMAAVCFLGARSAWRTGMRRWHGQGVERWAVEAATALMDRRRIRYETGRWVPGHGDVDLLILGAKGGCVVEIKSFERWSQSLFTRGERERAAIAQVEGLCDTLGTGAGLIWLPRGRPTALQRLLGAGSHRARVVFGNERAVIRRAKKIAGRLNMPWDGLI